ncbi:unnamed protein product, partial [marine sediment metagenome]
MERSEYYPHIQSTIRVFMNTFQSNAISVLDVGCRDGYATSLLRKFGYRAIGMEIEKEFVLYARKQGRPVIHGDAMNIPFSNCFDVVYTRHV